MTRATTATGQDHPAQPETHTGQCLCGAVRFEIAGPLAPPHACHCGQCRRQSGHFTASTHVARENLTKTEIRGLQWYPSSPIARRGFCNECGTVLFWDGLGDADDGNIYISVGCLDEPTGLTLQKHIFADEKGDYYEIGDGLPKFASYDEPLP